MAKILLVEDDKSLREIYGVRLMAEGYEIVSAGDGEEALATAIKERPALIVSDVMMPKISGFDMLDILRSTTETKDIKVIMMTALSSDDQRARGEALGADRYLVKSQVGIEDVVRTVHDVLGDGVASTAPAATTFPSTTTPAPTTEPAAPATAPLPEPVAPQAPAVAAPNPTAPGAPASMPAPTIDPVVPATPPMSPLPEPSMPPVINTPVEPVISPLPPAPVMPTAPTMPDPIAPVAPMTPEAPAATAAPVTPPTPPAAAPAFTLPEPTAPFSSPAPASLGDRVINPISPMEPANVVADIAAQMNQELNAALPRTSPQAPPAPPVPPAMPPTPGAAL
jgi:CheY-like chemotaxis protein